MKSSYLDVIRRQLLLIASMLLLGISFNVRANTCPDMRQPDHPDPLKAGWSLSPWSPSKDTGGSHSFAQIQISNYQVARKNTVSCLYDNNNLIIYKLGQFNHPNDPSLWFHTYEYDKCSQSIEACIYNSF